VKIGIQTWGSEGDVRPLLALASGLRAAGHDVTLAVTHVTNKDYTALGAAFGVPVRQVGRLDADLAKLAGSVLSGETFILNQVGLILRDLFAPAAQDMLQEAKRLCRENDLVIGHFLVHPLKTAAELSNRPHVSVFLAPLLPSSSYPPPGIPHLGRVMNSLLWMAGGALMNRLLLPPINAMRRAEGLRPVRRAICDVFLSPRLNLIASSPSLFPPPSDWDDTIHLCGAFHLPVQDSAPTLPEQLHRFIAAGPPPVYMTFGSMSAGDPVFGETVRLFAESARLAPCRAIIQAEGQVTGAEAEHPDILFIDRAEHHLVFPHCAAVTHHGGAGTTHAASRAGCPSIVVEHVTDQAFWGGVLHRAGIAPPMLHRRTVTADKLARAIRAALDSPSMREKALKMGESMRREDGVMGAVELIEEQRWK
jgi:sterol 3beta-glucosyltransferase